MTDSAASVEKLDILDEVGNPIGVKDRDAVHRDGDLHRVFHCLIVAGRLDGVAVLQLRAKRKAAYPGLLDLSAAGHLASGEEPLDGIREIAEELGVDDIPRTRLIELGTRQFADDSGEGTLNRELIHVHLVRDDRSLIDYKPNRSEVGGVFDAPINDALELFGGDVDSLELDGVVRGKWVRREVTLADFVPGSAYWIALLVMAQRYLDGHRPIAI